ncbi:TPA: transcription elongation factor GreA [Candidatus Bipolaricaulota bacterium]|nr:transcription elongation factor GreA [Candidatus Bipolaricaulota bacterium]
MAEILLTRTGYELKKKELEEYRQILYERIPNQLKRAAEHGRELRENKEYLDLMREQEFYEAEVRRLEELLDNARIIADEEISTEFVGLGSRVILEDRTRRRVDTIELVSAAEADLERRRISVDSPVGRALLNRHIGEEVEVELPQGKRLSYRILGIEKRGQS